MTPPAVPRVVAIGDNCVDVYVNQQRGYPGGGPVNFAVHVARQGVPAAYVGMVGTDRAGALLRDALRTEGVDVGCLQQADGPTALAWVSLENGDRAFLGANPGVRYGLRVDATVEALIHRAEWVHTTLDGRIEAYLPAWHADHKRISFDFSHRATPEQLALLPYVDVAFFSGQKIAAPEAPAAARAWYARGVRPGALLVVTLGADGSLAFDGTTFYHQAAVPTTVVDTLGAGDAFMAGFVLARLGGADVPAALAAGARTAAGVCTHHGGFGHPAPWPSTELPPLVPTTRTPDASSVQSRGIHP